MMTSVDTRVRKRHVNLCTQQRRLRHLESVSACNISTSPDIAHETEFTMFFTLHLDEASPAFYKSEKTHDIINPKWRNFDASQFPEHVNTSASAVIVRVWTTQGTVPRLMIEWRVFFSGLQYLGQQVLKNDKKFKPNTLVFGLFQGYYTASDCIQSLLPPDGVPSTSGSALAVDRPFVRKAYNVSSLQRIHTVQRAIKQTQMSIWRVNGMIHEHLKCAQLSEQKRSEREELRMKVNLLCGELESQKSKLVGEYDQLRKLKSSIQTLGVELNGNHQRLKADKQKLFETRKLYIDTRESLVKTNAQLAMRRKQLISELTYIYPITEVLGKGFTICGVQLPNSEDFSGQDETRIAISLGYVTHLVTMISQFLDVPLRYPVKHLGSRSKITDHIMDKIPEKEREFPLYSKGKDKIQFNYGVYLLNKNVAQLRYYCGFTTQDLRATLPNLQSLLDLQFGKYEQQSSGSQSFSDRSNLSNSSNKFGGSGVIPRPLRLGSDSTMPLSSNKFKTPGTPCSLPGNELISEAELKDVTRDGICMSKVHPDVVGTEIGTANLSCSLDKGLDELDPDPAKARANLVHGQRFRRHQVACGFHGGSEPNLAKHALVGVVHINIGEDHYPSSGDDTRPFFNVPPVEMWGTGSSHANSEDELAMHDGTTSGNPLTAGAILLPPGEESPLVCSDACFDVDNVAVYDGSSNPPTALGNCSVSNPPFQFQPGKSKSISNNHLESSREIEV